jgi:hypothetical protein
MLRTFKAILRGDSLKWEEDTGQNLRGDRPIQVLVTILEEQLEEQPITETNGRGKQMAAALEKLSQVQAFAGIDPVVWQRDVRQDRELPDRDE